LQKPNEKDDMAYSLSFGDGSSNIFSSMAEPSALMQQQLRYSQDQLRHDSHHSRLSVSASVKVTKKAANVDTSALPRTLRDVRRQKSRAIVVTETTKPFRVVDVNECWEGLCGFTLSEARGQTLGKLLKGPATNQVAATGLVTHLLHGDEAGAVLTNYTKNGREFRNRIRVGPLYDDETGTRITHFVGVLEEIIDEDLQQEAM